MCHINMLKPFLSNDSVQEKQNKVPEFAVPAEKSVTVPDSFPLPCIDHCIDDIGPANIITKLDLLKGSWQVPLMSQASEISSSVTPRSLQYMVIPFGVKNAPTTFQRLMKLILGDVPNYREFLMIHSTE